MYMPEIISNPEVIIEKFDGFEKECIRVLVFDSEYEMCKQAANHFWANSKPGVYGAGLGRTANDKHKPARTGLLGQMAFSKLFNEPVDLEYRNGGDQQDNLIGGLKWDIKCAMINRGKGLIYHTNEWGRRIPIDKDIYVFSYMEEEDRTTSKASIVFVGGALRKTILDSPIRRGKGGGRHLNHEVWYSDLTPITKLIAIKQQCCPKY